MCSTYITYIPIEKGFIYLTAVIDLDSRKIISWELSNSLDTELSDSDQGSQNTSQNFTCVLKQNGIRISMESKDRALENIFIESF